MIVHRSQRDAGKAGIEDVIEADDGVVPGDLDVVLGKSVDDAHGHHIVDGDEGRIVPESSSGRWATARPMR